MLNCLAYKHFNCLKTVTLKIILETKKKMPST